MSGPRREAQLTWTVRVLSCHVCPFAKNDVRLVYKKIEEGADVNFVFGEAYGCPEGYTPLMAAAHRARLECCKALLRAGADPNFMNNASDLVLFWGIDGGVEIIKLLYEARACRGRDERQAGATTGLVQRPLVRACVWRLTLVSICTFTREMGHTQYGADLDARTPKDWTPLSYARAKGKYGLTHEKGIYPEDVLKARRPLTFVAFALGDAYSCD